MTGGRLTNDVNDALINAGDRQKHCARRFVMPSEPFAFFAPVSSTSFYERGAAGDGTVKVFLLCGRDDFVGFNGFTGLKW